MSNDKTTAIEAFTAELIAASIAAELAIIQKAQHRIWCGLASDHRPAVIARLKELGIDEHAVASCAKSFVPALPDDLFDKLSADFHDARMKLAAIAMAKS